MTVYATPTPDTTENPPMREDRAAYRREARALVKWTRAHFVNRVDVYGGYVEPQYRDGKASKVLTKPAVADRGKKSLNDLVLSAHYMARHGGDVIGLHTTSTGNTCRFIVVEVDQHDEGDPIAAAAQNWKAVQQWYSKLIELGFNPLLEDSDGKGGFHLWVIFAEPIPSHIAFHFARWIVSDYAEFGLTTRPETFPKQDHIGDGEFGNWIRLFGLHHTRDHWSRFYTLTGWAEGDEAVELILQTEGDSPSLIPKHIGESLENEKAERDAEAAEAAKKRQEHDTSSENDRLTKVEIARRCLNHIPNGNCHYDDWLSVAAALNSVWAGMFADFRAWSRESEKHDDAKTEATWNSFRRSNGSSNVATIGTLIYLAKQNGYDVYEERRRELREKHGREKKNHEAAGEPTPEGEVVEPWPDPLPLPAGLPDVTPFNFDLLPTSLHGWIKDISERMQCPPDYPAATAIVMVGALIGRIVVIRPKQHDDWAVVPNLYGMAVGRPSVMKSPALREGTKPMVRMEIEAKQEYAKALEEFAATELLGEARKKVQKKSLEIAVKNGGDAQAIADEMAKGDDLEPVRKRYILNDATVEKVGIILAENPNGVLLFCDEVIRLLRTMDRDGHEGDRGFYLTAWAGDSRYTYDRVGRGTLDIEAAIISIIGAATPGGISDYLRGAVKGGTGDDGLIQRFQVLVWPDMPATWRKVDRFPDVDAKSLAYASFQRLKQLKPGDVEAERDNFDKGSLPFLRFDSPAQRAFDAWWTDLETRLRVGDLHPAVESHFAKYRSLIPSIALILHLLDGGVGPVSLSATEKAIGWGSYLESHARRLYSSVTDAPAVAARLLAKRIKAGDVPSKFAARDVYHNCWAGLDKDGTYSAIDVLLALHWIEERIEQTTGRPATVYLVNPKIEITPRRAPSKPTEEAFDGSVGSHSEDISFSEDPSDPFDGSILEDVSISESGRGGRPND